MKTLSHPWHVQIGAVIFSQLMLVFAAVLVYPYFYQSDLSRTQAANPPTVLSMSVTNVTFNSATVVWKTDVPTTSQVQYSAGTSKFDLSSPLDTNLVTDHSVTITNLEPSINYSIRTISTDSAGRTTRIQDDYYALTLYDKTAPYDFALDNFHSSSHVAQGYSAFFSVRSRQIGGQSSPTIVYTTQNIPTGISITNVGDYYGTYVFKVTASSSIAPGNYSFQVTGTAGGKTRTIILPLVVDAAPTAVTPLPYAYPAPAISQFDLWESNMKKYGTKMCNKTNIEAQGMWEGNVWYYDGIRVYYQMADYLNEPIWGTTCAQYAKSVYRPYVLASNGGVPGWRVFTRGFLVDWQKTGDTDSSNAVNLLSKNAAYGNVPIGAVVHEALSREVAYAVNAKMDSETAGFAPNPLLADYATVAIGHLDQWFQTGNHERIAPFMYGLTAEALISYEEKTGDLRVLPALQRGADYMWNNMWRGTGFCYQIFQDGASSCTTPAADLNMLIAPAYCWLYEKTGDLKYLTQSDQIFANGVLYAWLDQGKQFSQSYRLSFDYISCRQRVAGGVHGAPPNPPVISSVSVSNITSSSATVSWTTDTSADSQIEYGTTISYGSSNTLNTSLVTTHTQTLTGLNASTLYNFRVKSRDAGGNLTTSVNATFTTSAPADITPPALSSITAGSIAHNAAVISWLSNEASSTQIDYGTTTAYGNTTTLNASLVITHSQAVSQLSPATLYHYRVKSTDAAGNTAVSGDNTFTTASAPDVTPPALLSISVPTLSLTSATITWSTSEAATTQVRYGTTTSYGSTSALNGSLVIPHTVQLTGLQSNTLYHYQVVSTDAAGNTATSSDQTFTTQSAPVVTGVSAGTLTPTAATISWITSLLSTSQVEYGTTTSYGLQTPLDASLVTTHSVPLAGLNASTLYHYRVRSKDANGNETMGTANTFTTPAAADITPPAISLVTATNITTSSATITWITDENSTSLVKYGTTTSYGLQTPLDTSLTLLHSVTIFDLQPSTTYNFQVVSTNTVSLSGTSTNNTFTTNAISVPAASSSSASSPSVTDTASSFSRSSRSSLSSSLNPKAEREKALADYLASQAQNSSSLTSSAIRRQLRLKTPIELPSSSGFLAKTINSAQVIFKDVFITDYFAPAVDLLIELSIVSGYNDATGKPLGFYRPSRDVQYAEVAKMLTQLMHLTASTPANSSAQNTWAASYVGALETASPTIFTSNLNVFTPITRAQVIHAMADTLAITPNPNVGNFFSDTKDPLINTFKGMGIVKGNPDGTFRPDSPINRAEMATLLGRLLEQGYGQ